MVVVAGDTKTLLLPLLLPSISMEREPTGPTNRRFMLSPEMPVTHEKPCTDYLRCTRCPQQCLLWQCKDGTCVCWTGSREYIFKLTW